MVRTNAASLRRGIKRSQIDWSHILQNEVSTSVVVDTLDLCKDAVHVGRDVCSWDLRVCEKGVVAEIVGADPHGVDSFVLRSNEEFGSIGLDIFAVCDVGWDFVLLDSRKVGVDGRKGSRGDVVAADRAGYGIVVEVDAGVLFHVLRPRSTTRGRLVVLVEDY